MCNMMVKILQQVRAKNDSPFIFGGQFYGTLAMVQKECNSEPEWRELGHELENRDPHDKNKSIYSFW